MKRLISFIIAISMILSSVNIYASEGEEDNKVADYLKNSVILLVNSSETFVNGEKIAIDKENNNVKPVIVESRTLVPTRFLAESVGGSVDWNEQTRTASIICDDTTIEVPIGENFIKINGENKSLDVGGTIINNRTMLPLRGICEALGKSVEYYDGLITVNDDKLQPILNENNTAEFFSVREAIKQNLAATGKASQLKDVSALSNISSKRDEHCTIFSLSQGDMPVKTEQDKTWMCKNGMFFDNLSIKQDSKGENYIFSTDVYNTKAVYGIAEVFNGEGNLIKTKVINPNKGLNATSPQEVADNWGKLFVNGAKAIKTKDLGYLNYRLDSEPNHIEVSVPVDGYIYFTNNTNNSYYLQAYNMAHIIIGGISMTSAWADMFSNKPEGSLDTVERDMVKSFAESLIQDSPEAVARVYADFTSAYTRNTSNIFDSKKRAKAAVDDMIKSFKMNNIDVVGLLQDFGERTLGAQSEPLWNLLKENSGIFGDALNFIDGLGNTFDMITTMSDFNYTLSASSMVFEFVSEKTVQFNYANEIDGKPYIICGEDINGMNPFPVKESKANQLISFCQYKDKLYYIDAIGGSSYAPAYIYRCNKDGSNREVICSSAYNGGRYRILNNKLYYDACPSYVSSEFYNQNYGHNFDSSKNGIYAIDLETLSTEKICDGRLENMDNKYIYFAKTGGRNVSYYKYSLSSKTEEKISKKSIYALYRGLTYNGNIYYSNDENLYCYDGNKSISLVEANRPEIIGCSNGYIYYKCNYNSNNPGKYKCGVSDLCRIPANGGNAEKIAIISSHEGYGL